MSKKEQIKVTGGSIDKEVLDVMKQEDILKAVSDKKQVARLVLNCFAELLSEVSGLKKDLDETLSILSITYGDKIDSFYKGVQENVKVEEKRQQVQEKIHADHKKSKKTKTIIKK